MATFVIGDVHGCFRSLEALLRRLDIDYKNDRIWLVGDLVNRGPNSLEALRWAVDHSQCITMVLGNHELHLLAVEAGAAKLRGKDTLAGILEAPDRDDLLEWVRGLPVLHRDNEMILVHAGLRASWTTKRAESHARACESMLRGDGAQEALGILRGRNRGRQMPLSKVMDDLSFMTRVRAVDKKGRPNYDFTGPPSQAPKGHQPWFSLPDQRQREERVLFGHWAALGYRQEPRIIALDSGCLWGGALSAIRLEDGKLFQQISEFARS